VGNFLFLFIIIHNRKSGKADNYRVPHNLLYFTVEFQPTMP
jgi:hypothetical protein